VEFLGDLFTQGSADLSKVIDKVKQKVATEISTWRHGKDGRFELNDTSKYKLRRPTDPLVPAYLRKPDPLIGKSFDEVTTGNHPSRYKSRDQLPPEYLGFTDEEISVQQEYRVVGCLSLKCGTLLPSGWTHSPDEPMTQEGTIHHSLHWGSDQSDQRLCVPVDQITRNPNGVFFMEVPQLHDLSNAMQPCECPLFYVKGSADPDELQGCNDPDCISLVEFLYSVAREADLEDALQVLRAIDMILPNPRLNNLSGPTVAAVQKALLFALRERDLDYARKASIFLEKISAAS
jgi:hypothetical protein